MRKVIVTIALMVLVAAPVMADLSTRILVTDGPGGPNGGAFNIAITQGTISDPAFPLLGSLGTGDKFQTFCIETNEYLSYGNEYWVEVSNSATHGGRGGGDPDLLDPKSAALYSQWLALNSQNNVVADKYQLAIWQIEQEVKYDSTKVKPWVYYDTGAAIPDTYQGITDTTINGLIAGVGDPASIGSVRVMRLWGGKDPSTAAAKQDLLVQIPAPAAIGLGVLGLGLIGWYMRRFA